MNRFPQVRSRRAGDVIESRCGDGGIVVTRYVSGDVTIEDPLVVERKYRALLDWRARQREGLQDAPGRTHDALPAKASPASPSRWRALFPWGRA